MTLFIEKPTHFAVFLVKPEGGVLRYVFRAVGKTGRETALKNKKFVALKKIHPIVLNDVRIYAENARKALTEGPFPGVKIGRIDYAVLETHSKKIAASVAYYPKPEEDLMKGLGSYLEAVCLNHLKKVVGVTHVTTSKQPSTGRRVQLAKAEIPARRLVSINEWLEKLGKNVIRPRLKKK